MAERLEREWLRRETGARERRYQRGLVLALAVVLLGSLAPVVGAHMLGFVDRPFSGSDHVGALCLIALHVFMAPTHRALHVVVAMGVAWAVVDRLRLAVHVHRTLRGVVAREGNDLLARAAQRVGLDARRVRVVDALPFPAFTAGARAPVVYLASSLIRGPDALTEEELTAVMAHEAAHVRRRDPLRFAVLRALSQVLFWVPALRHLAEDIADEAEIAADDAAGGLSDPIALASALVKLGAWRYAPTPAVLSGAGVGFLRKDMLDRRVRRLLGEHVVPRPRLTRSGIAVAVAILTISTLSGVVDLHALPSHNMTHAADVHCAHDGMASFRHLFCRWGVEGPLLPDGGKDCPHQGH